MGKWGGEPKGSMKMGERRIEVGGDATGETGVKRRSAEPGSMPGLLHEKKTRPKSMAVAKSRRCLIAKHEANRSAGGAKKARAY